MDYTVIKLRERKKLQIPHKVSILQEKKMPSHFSRHYPDHVREEPN